MEFVKIPLDDLKYMKLKGFKELIPYTHKNPLVRWVFWKRLEVMLNLANQSKRVLDFGAGSGVFMPSLSKNFEEVYCLDSKTDALDYVKKKYQLNNVKIIKNEGSKLPFKNDFFDIIFAADVLEHFRDSTKIQREFRRVLKINGCLIVSGPTENFIYKLSRKIIFGYRKPVDHYTNIKEVIEKSTELFKMERMKIIPLWIIPGFEIFRARKT